MTAQLEGVKFTEKTISITIKVPESMGERLRVEAKRQYKSIPRAIVTILEEYLRREDCIEN